MCIARNSLISLCRGTGWETPVWGLRYQSCFPPCRMRTLRPLPASGSVRSASSNRELCHLAYAGYFAARQIPVEITKILLQLGHRFALRHVVGKLFQVAEPHLAVLPVDVPCRTHVLSLALGALFELKYATNAANS